MDNINSSEIQSKYCQHCGAKIDINCVVCPHCGKQVSELKIQSAGCNKWVAFLLCFFLGVFGIHHFYTGRYIMGIVYLFTFGLGGIGVIVDLILIATGMYCDRNGHGLVS